MKIGCLVKFLLISTIILGFLFYIFINKFDEFILRPGIKYAISFALDGADKELAALPVSEERDSLIKIIENYTLEHLKFKHVSLNATERIADSLRSIIKDRVIDPKEIDDFDEYIQKVLENERRKKNGD